MIREQEQVFHGVGRIAPRVGIIGGGQLARMLVEAAIPLEVDVRVLVRRDDEAAATVARDVAVGDWSDLETLLAFAEECDVVTFDHELVPPPMLEALAESAVLHPQASAMTRASNKATQRELAAAVGIAVAPHARASNPAELPGAVAAVGFPAVVKAACGGYDGRAVWWVRTPGELDTLVRSDALGSGPLLVEPALNITEELATLVARRGSGEHVRYPVVRTEQRDGVCAMVTAPAVTTPALASAAQDGAVALAEELDYVGVLAVEYFVVGGELLLNELAPRPHNSGHYTIHACVTSQFENHLRAVLGWPLGDPSLITPAAVMANLVAASSAVLALGDVALPPGASVHLYGKDPLPGRKVGHVTVCGDDPIAMRRTAFEVAEQLTGNAFDVADLAVAKAVSP